MEPFIAGAVPGTEGRIFYDGWLDLDLDKPKEGEVTVRPVCDLLVGVNLVGDRATTGNLRLVAEGRYNDYFKHLQDDNPALKDVKELNPFGMEVGLSYFVGF